jgi:membrane protein YdbS with pleckstrin-like domain
MLNNIFKLLFLITAIFIAIILVAIYPKMNNGRYQVSAATNGKVIIDTQTGILYEDDGNGGYIIHKDGKEIKLKQLPD